MADEEMNNVVNHAAEEQSPKVEGAACSCGCEDACGNEPKEEASEAGKSSAKEKLNEATEKLNEAAEKLKNRSSECWNSLRDNLKKEDGPFRKLCKWIGRRFTLEGRASVGEFWLNILILILFVLCKLLGLSCCCCGGFLTGLCCIIGVVLVIWNFISVYVRRLHDLNLSGFWVWYLSPLGFPAAYLIHALDVDPSCNRVMERVEQKCTSWILWLLVPLFWFVGSQAVMLILLLTAGKKEENQYGA